MGLFCTELMRLREELHQCGSVLGGGISFGDSVCNGNDVGNIRQQLQEARSAHSHYMNRNCKRDESWNERTKLGAKLKPQ